MVFPLGRVAVKNVDVFLAFCCIFVVDVVQVPGTPDPGPGVMV
jgi:hypothetical protein